MGYFFQSVFQVIFRSYFVVIEFCVSRKFTAIRLPVCYVVKVNTLLFNDCAICIQQIELKRQRGKIQAGIIFEFGSIVQYPYPSSFFSNLREAASLFTLSLISFSLSTLLALFSRSSKLYCHFSATVRPYLFTRVCSNVVRSS